MTVNCALLSWRRLPCRKASILGWVVSEVKPRGTPGAAEGCGRAVANKKPLGSTAIRGEIRTAEIPREICAMPFIPIKHEAN